MELSKQTKSKHPMLILTLLIVILVFLIGCGKKTQEVKVYQVSIISGAEAFVNIVHGFKAKMTELGYFEGENIVYTVYGLDANLEEENQAAQKLIEDKVDLIFAFPTDPAVVAKAAVQGTNIPVVFAMAGIEGNNLVESVSKPGGNVTGVRFPGPDNCVKRFEILHELVPDAKRIYLIYDPNYPNAGPSLKGLRPTASSLGITLVENPVNNVEELQVALQERAAKKNIGIDAILLMPDILNHSPDGFGAILKFANEQRVPIGGGGAFTADLGATFSFAPDFFETGMLAAPIADKILKGTPAGTIAVVTAQSHLRLNYKMIQELGLTVPEGLLSRAEEIIR
jgi:putative ABC transport system substrate-binding protein